MSNEESTNRLIDFLRTSGGMNPGNAMPQRPGPGPGLGLLGRPEVTGLYFNNRTVDLDGYRFSGCRFDNCVLRLNTTNFEIVRCVLDHSTRVEYSAALAKVLQLFIGRYDWAPQYFPEFFLPTRHEDGSITINNRGA